MRIVVATPGLSKFNQQSTTRDVIIVSDLFGDPRDMTIYNKLLQVRMKSVLFKKWNKMMHWLVRFFLVTKKCFERIIDIFPFTNTVSSIYFFIAKLFFYPIISIVELRKFSWSYIVKESAIYIDLIALGKMTY